MNSGREPDVDCFEVTVLSCHVVIGCQQILRCRGCEDAHCATLAPNFCLYKLFCTDLSENIGTYAKRIWPGTASFVGSVLKVPDTLLVATRTIWGSYRSSTLNAEPVSEDIVFSVMVIMVTGHNNSLLLWL